LPLFTRTSEENNAAAWSPPVAEKNFLRLPHHCRHRKKCATAESDTVLERSYPPLDRLDTGLPANAAARRNGEVAFEALAQSRGGDIQDDVDRVGLRSALRIAQASNLA